METSIFFFSIFFGQLIYVDYKCKSFTDVTTFSPRLYGIFTASVNPYLSSFLAWGLSRQVNGHAGQSACNLVSAIRFIKREGHWCSRKAQDHAFSCMSTDERAIKM